MFEQKGDALATRMTFFGRVIHWLSVTLVLIAASLLLGICGYHFTENMPWLDSLLNASMILGGMGPVDPLHTAGGKLFASFYAIYSGLFLIICGGLFLVPVFHRVLHHFHADDDDAR